MQSDTLSCTCLVQENQIPDDTQASLRSKLDGLAQQVFGAGLSINWITVPEGGGFTAAKPSTSSLVSVQSNKALAFEARKSILSKMCDIWMDDTGCSLDEIVAVVTDPTA